MTAVIVRALVDNDRLADYLFHGKPVCEKVHDRSPMIRKQHREITGMITMRLVVRIPVPACRCKRLRQIALPAAIPLMEMKAMRPDRLTISSSCIICRQSADFCLYPGSARYVKKTYPPSKIWRQFAATDLRHRSKARLA